MNDLSRIREELSGDTMYVDGVEDESGIFDQVDAFVNLTRDNKSVQKITLWIPVTDPYTDSDGTDRYAIWEKVAEGIGNLQALRKISITDICFADDEEGPLAPDWEILACILRRLRRGIHLCMQDETINIWDTEALPAFARAIHGQAMITRFSTGAGFPFHCLDILCSALLTLPALENIKLGQYDDEGPEEGQSFESMVKLLQSPILQLVKFESVAFTNTFSQAVAKALKERSEITDLRFLFCSFPEGGGAVIASVLKTSTTLKSLDFQSSADEDFCEVLAEALLSNSTLQNLSFDGSGSYSRLSPLFLALQVNEGLTKLSIDGIKLIDKELSTAMRLGLGNNATLESLQLSGIKSGHNDTCLWRETLSFLRTNTTLKVLVMDFEENVTKAHATAIRMEVLAILRENKSLETLAIPSDDAEFEDYVVFVAAVQPNTTLKRLCLHDGVFDVDDDKLKDLVPVLTKNYGLEEFPGLRIGAGDIHSIFDLNRAGRRYLVQDRSSISKGVDVLSLVSSDINSIFLHLLENPRLCDRSAVEMPSTGNIGNMENAARTTSPGNRHSGGKREQQAPPNTVKEARRRLE
jgi:hypothetical protein